MSDDVKDMVLAETDHGLKLGHHFLYAPWASTAMRDAYVKAELRTAKYSAMEKAFDTRVKGPNDVIEVTFRE